MWTKSIWVSALPSLGLEPTPHVTEVLKRSLRQHYKVCHLTGDRFRVQFGRKNINMLEYDFDFGFDFDLALSMQPFEFLHRVVSKTT